MSRSPTSRHLVLLALLAIAAAVPRFGQRENQTQSLSDSDYYLDMAAAFAGAKDGFDPVWSGAGHFGAHHYARPLLPFLAGWAARIVPAVDVRAMFSLVNILCAWTVAAALYFFVARVEPAAPPWLPSALFLTGFPQIDWGFHLLTDTIGYATAFLASLTAWRLLRWYGAERPRPTDPRLVGGLVLLSALQALAFLARETGMMVPVVVLWLLFREGFPRRIPGFGCAVLAAIAVAVLPRQLYIARLALSPLGFYMATDVWLDPGYMLDFLVKSALAFHVFWVVAVIAGRGTRAPLPDLVVGWSLAALLYMGAGYIRNTPDSVGYPLRLTYALFPLIYLLAARFVAQLAPARRLRAALALVGLNAAIGLTGTVLDPGTTGLTVPALIGRRSQAGGGGLAYLLPPGGVPVYADRSGSGPAPDLSAGPGVMTAGHRLEMA